MKKANAKWYARNREEILWRNRIRYHKNKKARRKHYLQNLEWKRKHKFECSERLARRNAKRKPEYEERKKLELRRIISLATLKNPTYRVCAPTGTSRLESWPPKDEAQRWLEAHDTAVSAVSSSPLTPRGKGA